MADQQVFMDGDEVNGRTTCDRLKIQILSNYDVMPNVIFMNNWQ